MTRVADPAKKNWLLIQARDEQERQFIGAFKLFASENRLEVSELFFSVFPVWVKQFGLFSVGDLVVEEGVRCERCFRVAVVWATCLQTRLEHRFCLKCFCGVPNRYDSKVWKITQDKRHL